MMQGNKHRYKIMKKSKSILVIATCMTCTLLLTACGKSEGEESIGSCGVYVRRLKAHASTYIIGKIIEMNQDFLLEQVKALPVVKTDEIPYGTYACESGATASIENFQNEIDINEIDVIHISLNGDGLMTNFEWAEGKTYNLIMPSATSPLATATFDENGNMQITAFSNEAKPYEGYYTK